MSALAASSTSGGAASKCQLLISSREGVAMAFAPSRTAADSTVASESELTAADVNVPNSSQGKKSGSDDEKAGLLHGVDAPHVLFSADTFLPVATAPSKVVQRTAGP